MKNASLIKTVIIPNGLFTADLLLALATLKMAGFKGRIAQRDEPEITEVERADPKTILLNVGREINAPRSNYDFSESRRCGVALAILEAFSDTTNEPVARKLASDLYYRVNQIQIGQPVAAVDSLNLTVLIANFNNVDKGFAYAQSLTNAILVSHVATIRKELKINVV